MNTYSFLKVRLRLLAMVLAVVTLGNGEAPAQTNAVQVTNPHWSIIINDFGYADVALDLRPGFFGREYLSGEWAAAVSYVRNSVPNGPRWLNPEFLFPDWDSNSDFGVETPVASTGTSNAYGFAIYRAVITNASLRIGIRSEMLDTTNGIPQGLAPRSAPNGSNVVSDRYVFRQSFGITNRSGVTLSAVNFFKFCHSLEATAALFDDRAYAGTFGGHRYAITQAGLSPGFFIPNLTNYFSNTAPVLHYDVVAQHGNSLPSAWEVGHYGVESLDDHVFGKPSEGVHFSVEADALSNFDYFAPPERWVSGAVRHTIGTLAANASTNLEYLMSVRTETWPVELRIQRVGGDALLSWPAATGLFFSLTESDSVTSTNWDYVFEPVEVQGTNNTVTVPLAPQTKFFRLGL